MSTHEEKTEAENLVNYRLDRLEEAITSLTVLKDIVARWDVRFGNTDFLQCPLHNERMIHLSKRMDVAETDIGQLKKFVYKATGALVIISIIVQLLVPVILEHLKTDVNRTQVELLGK
jgi:glutathionylspermidine synthase